jgi:hypothetical protein
MYPRKVCRMNTIYDLYGEIANLIPIEDVEPV